MRRVFRDLVKVRDAGMLYFEEIDNLWIYGAVGKYGTAKSVGVCFTSKITAMAGLFEHPLGEFELVSLGDLWTYLLLSFVLVFSVIRLMQF